MLWSEVPKGSRIDSILTARGSLHKIISRIFDAPLKWVLVGSRTNCTKSNHLKAYKTNVATGNLSQHLRDAHEIISAPVADKSQRLLSSVFSSTPAPRTRNGNSTEDKNILTRQLALMCCRDLAPFGTVKKEGFRLFLKQRGAIKDYKDLPEPETISRAALNDIYDTTYAQLLQVYSCWNLLNNSIQVSSSPSYFVDHLIYRMDAYFDI